MIIATHSGNFHADEVFAIAILKQIYPEAKIIRTRDDKKLEKADLRIDVGKKYNGKTDFDHHQKEFNECRENKIPYSSCGLIWKHFGKDLVSEEAWKEMDTKLIQFIDLNDSGIKSYETTKSEPFTIADSIDSFNPDWNEAQEQDKKFKQALKYAEEILKNIIKKEKSKQIARKKIQQKIKNNPNKEYLVLEEYMPWKKEAVKSDLKYIIYPGFSKKKWCSRAIPVEKDSFKTKKPFPESWRGLSDKELEKATGIIGAKFCHKDGFILFAETKQQVVKLTEKSLSK